MKYACYATHLRRRARSRGESVEVLQASVIPLLCCAYATVQAKSKLQAIKSIKLVVMECLYDMFCFNFLSDQ